MSQNWQEMAVQMRDVALRLAGICAERAGCCFDNDRRCPEHGNCALCWYHKVLREGLRKEKDDAWRQG